MKVTRIIATTLVSMSMALFLGCGEQKTASLEGHEDKVAVLQKLVDCLDTPETAAEIYAEDAVLKWQDYDTAQWREQKGLNEIQKYYKDKGIDNRYVKLDISDIKEDAKGAHVEYQITLQDRGSGIELKSKCSAEMVNQGQGWKVKNAISKRFE